jgi:hypothetical protein
MPDPIGRARIDYVMSVARKEMDGMYLAEDETSYTGYSIVFPKSEARVPASVFEVILWEKVIALSKAIHDKELKNASLKESGL